MDRDYYHIPKIKSSKIMHASDRYKAVVLILLYLGCLYSAFTKFVLNQSQNFKLEINYKDCDIIQDKLSDCKKNLSNPCSVDELNSKLKQCKDIIEIIYTKSNKICQPYIKNLDKCKKIRPKECVTDRSNLEGCIASIQSTVLKENYYHFDK